MADVKKKLLGKLSKGYRQRVGLAQAIIHNPEVLILDEPTAGLDPKQINETRDLIKGLSGSHTIILSTHILPEVEQTCEPVSYTHLDVYKRQPSASRPGPASSGSSSSWICHRPLLTPPTPWNSARCV